MTLAAPKSRQGKFVLVLAFLAAVIAVLGVFIWSTTTQATFAATVTITDNAAGPTINQGEAIQYTIDVSGVGSTGVTLGPNKLVVDFDDTLVGFFEASTSGTWTAGECTVGAGNVVTCDDTDTIALVNSTVVLQFLPGGSSIVAPTVPGAACTVFDTDVTVQCTELAAGDLDAVTVNPWGITPASATNAPDNAHTVTFSLPLNVTCESDTSNDGVRTCGAGDVVISDTQSSITLSSGPTVTDSVLSNASDVTVVVNSPQATVGTITLSVHHDNADGTFADIDDPVASKTYAVVNGAGGTGEIRHLDEADQATEDAAGTAVDLSAYCASASIPVFDCGILDAQDDADDAVGSFHQACMINTNLTHAANSADITWNIAAGPGSSATVNPNPNGVNVSGPNGEPCVRWGSAGTGSQTINATYDNGIDPVIQFYYSNGSTPLPLVKEWNDLDETKIVAVDGYLGATDILGNTEDLADWANRDCSFDPVDPGFCDAANVDGLTIAVEGIQIPTIPAGGILISADPTSFIEYVNGSHSDAGGAYDGPIDGVSQTFTVTGDCGSVRVEDPQNGGTLLRAPGATADVLFSSDKGVGITFYTNTNGVDVTTGANGTCLPDDEICVDVTDTIEANLFDSGPLQTAADESICVHFEAPLDHVSKTPTLAWAGQRVVLTHDWTDVSDCDGTYVLYSVQAGPGSFTAALQGVSFNASQTGQDAIVQVDGSCESHVIFENQDQAQNDIIAYVVDGPDLSTATPVSQQVPFVIYYLKFEDAVLTLVPGERDDHNSGEFDPAGPFDSSSDVDSMSDVNVSADVLARLRVRGWVTTTNCPVRDSATGANGEFLPANRCIFPDDWRFKAGGGVGDSLNDPATAAGFAEESRPNFDLDGSGVINAWDAPMPPALASFELSGAGFLRPTDKLDVYPNSGVTANPNYSQRIPASDLIAPINADLSGYQWDGIYNFWTDLADHGAEVWSCAGPSTDAHAASDCDDPAKAMPTGGYHGIKIYTDNHGEAMTWINGDASLDFSDCTSSAAAAGHMIVLLDGYYCEDGADMGDSTLGASVDYPDKRKHFAIQTNDVTIDDWTWGGIKEVTIEDGADANGQFSYIVFHVTDRDGFCDSSTSLHPVLGERVTFQIDSPSGTIIANENGVAVALAGTWTTTTADVTTFDTDAEDTIADGGLEAPTLVAGECQAWIHITESLLNPVNIIVTAFDPEGTVTFDKIVNEPPEPTAPPTDAPTPTPFALNVIWGDTDCDSDVGSRDSQAILRNVLDQSPLSVDLPCLEISQAMTVVGHDGSKWSDWDCDGGVGTRDSQSILRHILSQPELSQTGDCPEMGEAVVIQPLIP